MQAKDVMTTKVVTVAPEAPVADIARRMIEHRISALPVVDEGGAIVGLVSEGDLMRRPESDTERVPSWWLRFFADSQHLAELYLETHGRAAKDVMTRDVITVGEDATLAEIASLLERHRIKRVPVVRAGRLVGIVSRADLLHGLVAHTAGGAPSQGDREIRAALHRAFEEAGVNMVFVSAIVTDGVVQLWGGVASEEERRAVHLAAESTPGVTKIEDHVGVFSPTIKSALWAE